MVRPLFVRFALAAAVTSFLASISATAFAQEPVELRWKLEPGEAFVTEWKQGLESRAIVQDAQDQVLRRIETTHDLSMRIGWKIASVAENGDVVTEQRIEALTLAVRAPGNILRQLQLPSSEEPPKEFAALAEALKQALGVPIRVTLSPRGEPLAAELSEAWTKLAENEELGPSAQQLATPEGWKSLLGNAIMPLPEAPVAVGATWSSEDPQLGRLPYRMTSIWTLAGVEDDVATMTLRSTAEQTAPDAGVAPGDAANAGAGEGGTPPGGTPETAGVAVTGFERTGGAAFDLADGMLLSQESQTKINLGKRLGEYLLSTQQTGTLTIETKKVDPQAAAESQTPDDSQSPEAPANGNEAN
ncbi:MAG TPA: DUF6263 family protein [Pirellulaceae bacterium]|jgi:hypothetical protein|nr:DUF6263 family protein [Pirellulaceae bacterium]